MADSMKRKPHAGNWKPGQSGNPSGRPKIVGEIQHLARKATTLAIETLTRIASDRKAPPAAQVAAAVALLDRGYGRPGQAVDLNVNRKTHDEMSDAELIAIAAAEDTVETTHMKIKAKLLDSVCVVSEDGRKANLESVLKRQVPQVRQLPAREGQLAIVASGPSLRDYQHELVDWPGEVWAINGAYNFLLDQNIIPDGFFAIDPLPGLSEYVQKAHSKTTFYIASTGDPSVFDALEGHKVQVFHAAGMDYPQGQWQIGGGTTAATRVGYLGLLQGWREMVMYGVDSSYQGREYCYEWGTYSTDIAGEKVWVKVTREGPAFETEVGLMKQCTQLAVLHAKFNGMLKFRCNGLLAAFMRSPMMDDSQIEVEDAA